MTSTTRTSRVSYLALSKILSVVGIISRDILKGILLLYPAESRNEILWSGWGWDIYIYIHAKTYEKFQMDIGRMLTIKMIIFQLHHTQTCIFVCTWLINTNTIKLNYFLRITLCQRCLQEVWPCKEGIKYSLLLLPVLVIAAVLQKIQTLSIQQWSMAQTSVVVSNNIFLAQFFYLIFFLAN